MSTISASTLPSARSRIVVTACTGEFNVVLASWLPQLFFAAGRKRRVVPTNTHFVQFVWGIAPSAVVLEEASATRVPYDLVIFPGYRETRERAATWSPLNAAR